MSEANAIQPSGHWCEWFCKNCKRVVTAGLAGGSGPTFNHAETCGYWDVISRIAMTPNNLPVNSKGVEV